MFYYNSVFTDQVNNKGLYAWMVCQKTLFLGRLRLCFLSGKPVIRWSVSYKFCLEAQAAYLFLFWPTANISSSKESEVYVAMGFFPYQCISTCKNLPNKGYWQSSLLYIYTYTLRFVLPQLLQNTKCIFSDNWVSVLRNPSQMCVRDRCLTKYM